MNTLRDLQRELGFAAKNNVMWFWLALVLLLSSIAVGFGVAEVQRQQHTIQQLVQADAQDRDYQTQKMYDWGSAAYYNFHVTYDAPSSFAYAALGQRDSLPWKHRIRMLALEGQIYERDVGNPSLAIVGRFDFAFFAAFVIPLVLMMMLYDQRASEQTAGRFNLLESTAASPNTLWLLRASVPATGVFIALCLPMVIGGLVSGAAPSLLLQASLGLLAYIALWVAVCTRIAAWQRSSGQILMTLIGLWLSVAVVLPAAAKLAIDRLIPIPAGADILMLQRETVNDAWDLPRQTTMNAFFAEHPEWAHYQPQASSFEWQWYYAFQQVGDQTTAPLASAYQQGRLQRANAASAVALITPPALLERWLQTLANTDLHSSLAYEQRVRDYHAELRAFYYPKLFGNQAFDKAQLVNLPPFQP